MKVVYAPTPDHLEELYDQSALTWEGMTTDEDNLNAIEKWIKEHGVDTSELVIHITLGKTMNEVYDLTGTNEYKDDLTIVSVTGIDVGPLIIPRFEVGGRWFDDIVDNNEWREKEKRK